MPRVATFDGIEICIYFNDHVPPHFHAKYAGQEAQIAISPVALRNGSIPSPQLSRVIEWARDNQAFLLAKWNEINPGK